MSERVRFYDLKLYFFFASKQKISGYYFLNMDIAALNL